MNTQTAVIPDQLLQWRPSCGMFAGYEPECVNAADHALVTHGGCQVRLTCMPCYGRFRAIFDEWIAARPPTNIIVCDACRDRIDTPWDALHLEPL